MHKWTLAIFLKKLREIKVLITRLSTVWKKEKFTAKQNFFRQINLEQNSLVNQ